jgi:hypothetical protein
MASSIQGLGQRSARQIAAEDQRSLETLERMLSSYQIPQKHAHDITRLHLSKTSLVLVMWTKRGKPRTGQAEQQRTSGKIDAIIDTTFDGSEDNDILRWRPDIPPVFPRYGRPRPSSRYDVGTLARDLQKSSKCHSCKKGWPVKLQISMVGDSAKMQLFRGSSGRGHKIPSMRDDIEFSPSYNFQDLQAESKSAWDREEARLAQRQNGETLIAFMLIVIHWDRMTSNIQETRVGSFERIDTPLAENLNLASLRRYLSSHAP